MIKYSININEKDKKQLVKITSCNENKQLYRNKAKVLLLRANGKPIEYIAKETNLSERTINNYILEYIEYEKTPTSISRFIIKNNYKNSRLKDFYNTKQCFISNPPKSYREAADISKKELGITISESTIRRYFIKNKIKLNKKKTIDD